jgi:uncharacterized repeat protein (TIGR03943 family)
MNTVFSRWLPCVTLATWSAILLTIFYSGRVRDLLAPEFRPGVVIAGVVMGLMALVFLLLPVDAGCCSSAECSHSVSRRATGKVITFLMLLLPISAAAVFSPEGFSANLVKNRGAITDVSQLGGAVPRFNPAPADLPLPTKADPAAAPQVAALTPPSAPAAPAEPAAANTKPSQPAEMAPGDYLQRTADGAIIAEVLDLLYAAQDNTLRKDFEDKRIELVGQLMPDTANNASGKRFKAVRMFMTCCAADARPIAALVEAADIPGLPEMTWIKITGTSTFPIENGRRISLVKADKVEKTSPPDESMLY